MLYKSKYYCNFVEQHSTRYSYAYTEVRGEPFGSGAQTAHQACEVGGEVLHANILLAVDKNGKKPMTVMEAAAAFNTSPTTVQNVRTKYATEGLKSTITRKKRESPPVPAKCTGDVEAKIIATACSAPPEGRGRWTLRLLSERVVELEIVPSISKKRV